VIGVVDSDSDACPVCFMVLPPRLYSEILKNPDKIFRCPNCGRFLTSLEGD